MITFLRRMRPGRATVFALLVILAATTAYPFYFMATNALKRRVEYYSNTYGLPRGLYFGNFTILRENINIIGALLHSLLVVCIAVAVSTLLAALAAFPLAKIPFAGSKIAFGAIFSLLLVPGQVLLIPIYLFFSKLHLIDNYLSLICVYVATALPFGVFLLVSNFRGIPTELMDSARIDGASTSRVFISIVVPVGRPAILTLVILSFLGMWNELLLALMLIPDETKRLLTPTLTTLVGQYVTNQPLLMTGLLFNSIPTIIVLVIFSRYLVRGMVLGMGR